MITNYYKFADMKKIIIVLAMAPATAACCKKAEASMHPDGATTP